MQQRSSQRKCILEKTNINIGSGPLWWSRNNSQQETMGWWKCRQLLILLQGKSYYSLLLFTFSLWSAPLKSTSSWDGSFYLPNRKQAKSKKILYSCLSPSLIEYIIFSQEASCVPSFSLHLGLEMRKSLLLVEPAQQRENWERIASLANQSNKRWMNERE